MLPYKSCEISSSPLPSYPALAQKPETQTIQGVREVMNTVSARLSEDRRELAAWVAANKLSEEIEVQSIPVDGSFLLVKATRVRPHSMLCACAQGGLPALVTELGH